jgi:hypothetical protein
VRLLKPVLAISVDTTFIWVISLIFQGLVHWEDATLSKEHQLKIIDGVRERLRADTQFEAQPFCGKKMLLNGESASHDSIRRIA